MDFSAEQANQIMQAQKTTHRYPAKRKRCEQRRGQLLDVNKTTVLEDGSKERERKSHRVRVLSVARGRVEAVSEIEARSEGFKTRERFLEAYEAAFGVREGDCWVLSFEVAEPVNLLAPCDRPAHSEHGYVQSSVKALPEEPEALDREVVSSLSMRSRERGAGDAKKVKAQALQVAAQVRDEAFKAHRAGLDVSEHLLEVQRTLLEMRRMREKAA